MSQYRKKKLPPYGDYDQDGAPNWSDCDPRDPNEQGIFKRAVGVITRDKYGQTAEEYAEEKQKLEELKAKAEAAGIDTSEIGIVPQAKETLKKWANVGTRDPGVAGMQKAIYGQPTPQYRRTYQAPPQPVQQQEPQYPVQAYPPVEDEYTYKSHYYRKPGYIYLPSVKKPKRHRPRPHQAVNPFKRSKQMFRNAGLNARPIKIQCPYCGTINYSYVCQKCGARLR